MYQTWWPLQEQKLLNELRPPVVPVLLTWEENTVHLLDWPRERLTFDDVIAAAAKPTAHSHMGRWGLEGATPSPYTEVRHRVFIMRPLPTTTAPAVFTAAGGASTSASASASGSAKAAARRGGGETGDERFARFITRELRKNEPVPPPPPPFFLVVGPELLAVTIRGSGEFPVQLRVEAHLTVYELKVLYAEAGGGTPRWMDLALEGEFLRNEQRLFDVRGLHAGTVLRAVVQPGGPLMLLVRTFWGKTYRVQVYRTTDVAELARSVLFHCVSDSCPDDFVDQQFVHAKEFAVKVGARALNDSPINLEAGID